MIKIEEKEWRRINELIYEMNAEEDIRKSMDVFLEGMHELIYFEKASIILYNIIDGKYQVECFIGDNVPEKEIRDYNEHFYKMDDVMLDMHGNPQKVVKSTGNFDYSERMQTEYYKDYVRPVGAHYSIDGGFCWQKNYLTDGFGTFDLFKSHTEDDFSDKDLEISKILSPHLANKARMYVSSMDDYVINVFRDCRFTKMELEVAKLILVGYENESIARSLDISVSTVKKHVANILQKVNANSKFEFVSMVLSQEEKELLK